MNTTQQFKHSADSRDEAEYLLQEALFGTLEPAQLREFIALLDQNPDLKQEYTFTQLLEQAAHRHSVPEHSEQYWNDFTDRIESRLPKPAYSFLHWKNIVRYRPVIKQAAGLAAMICMGFFAGRWSSNRESQNPATLPYQQASPVRDNDTIEQFLQESHLLLLGMMNLSSECRMPDVQTLQTQQHTSVALLYRAQNLRRSLAPDKTNLSMVLSEIEYALIQIAALKPNNVNPDRIQRIQTCSGSALCEISTTLKDNQTSQQFITVQ